jgi:hypothetical protein
VKARVEPACLDSRLVRSRLEKVAADPMDTFVVRTEPGVGKVVLPFAVQKQRVHFVIATDKRARDVRAHESGRTGQKDAHQWSFVVQS